ncbi:MAG: hypothetical protein AVDCRST_MAG25-1169 [uncultured Rubrobacteraceae bacterium]|uniref:Lipoprotein n=1 Tax=uncultured Rubrobacteraceae bacterium TaxID=349277 RepID=A0A6J4RA49_9ACTN|nr:MAG: hypothetical protein AVDCRST_MAG25-1169 [uncultured Rubrobacteraceae bacterium]
MRKLLTMLALAAIVVLAGACGSSEDGGSSAKSLPERGTLKGTPGKVERPTPVETVQVAYRETAAESTAKTSFEITTTGPPVNPESSGQSDPVTMTGRGVVSFSGAASSMTVEMLGMGGFEMRQIEDTVYVKMPEDLVAQMPDAKPWMEVDLEAMYGQQYDASPAQMQGGAAQDPTRQLEYLRGVSDSVEKVGVEEVRGVRTTHYEAVVDLKNEAAGGDAEAQEAQDEMVEKLGASKFPVEVWLDDQNRVRRYAMNATVPVPEDAPEMSEGGKMQTSIVAEYYDFGTPVDVQAPPPDQTMDGSKLLPAQQPVAR